MGGTVSRPKPNVPGGEHLDGDLAEEEEEEETTTPTPTTSEMRGESDVSVGKVFKNPSLLEKKRKRRRSPTTEEETTTKKRPVKKSKMIEVAKFNTRKIHGDEKGEGTHATCEHGFIHAVVRRRAETRARVKTTRRGASGDAVGFFLPNES